MTYVRVAPPISRLLFGGLFPICSQFDWSQADEAIIAKVPELPGCAADGKTNKETLTNVEIISQEWIETAKELGRPNPAPRGRLAFAQESKTAPFEKPNAKGC